MKSRLSAPTHTTSDIELLKIELETIWPTDARGRIKKPELIIASGRDGLVAAVGSRVPDILAADLLELVSAATPSAELRTPPPVLEECQRLLEASLGPLQLAPASGPSYVIPESVGFVSGGALLFYSTSGSNVSSQRVAARLGLRPLGWLWQLALAA